MLSHIFVCCQRLSDCAKIRIFTGKPMLKHIIKSKQLFVCISQSEEKWKSLVEYALELGLACLALCWHDNFAVKEWFSVRSRSNHMYRVAHCNSII